MKAISILSILMLTCTILPAQKQDNTWVFGYVYTQENPDTTLRIILNFDDSLKITYDEGIMRIDKTSAMICDSSGKILLFSNGCYIANVNDAEIQGSQGLNPGALYNIFCSDGGGYNFWQNMILLPDPSNQTVFHFFHMPAVLLGQYPFVKNILHTVVDISANNGQGNTLLKNQVVVNDTMHYDGMHAVKHANGRDWWIIGAKWNSNKYHIVLLDPSGITAKAQAIGDPTMCDIDWASGQIVFSPDGSKMARYNPCDDLRLFDFDRCTGELSNPLHIPVFDSADSLSPLGGVAFSADGRYLYLGSIRLLYQYDLQASDIAASRITVAVSDGVYCSFLQRFGLMELGPDGRLYVNGLTGGDHCMHRIKSPEKPGTACEVEQRYFYFDYPIANLPHFPNFRLGPIDGSSCDTLGLDNHPLAGWRYDKTGGLGVDFTSVSWYEPDTWWWDFGDGTQSNERNPAHSFPAPGAYEVCLTVSNQYGSDTKCKWVWVSTVGTDEGEGLEGEWRLFPNPTTGIVQWSGLPEGESTTVRVHDAIGRLCFEQETTESRADLGGLPDGVYFVTLRLGGNGGLVAAKAVVLAKK
ncbi:MAG: PKD domain-containing protein [Saprospiraceae bacterium]